MDFVENRSNWHRSSNRPHIREIQAAQDTFIVNLCAVAALTWVLYDMLLCFEQEVSLVWWRWREQKGRHSRRIYVIVRYFSILNLALYVGVNTRQDLSQNTWHYIVVINATIITLLPDAMALIRINAVYDWDHTSMVSLVFFARGLRMFLMGCFIIFANLYLALLDSNNCLAVGALAVSTTEVPHPTIGSLTVGCPSGKPKYHPVTTLAAWIPSIVAQSIYFSMMLTTFVHVLQDLDSDGKTSAKSLSRVRKLVPTMMAFISNGSYYFIIAITTKVVNAIVVVIVSGPLRGVGIPMMMALYPVVVTRTYLNMVAHLHAEPNDTVVYDIDQDMMLVSSSSTLVRPHIESGQITFATIDEEEC